jgi:hypothetical protein
MPPLNKASEEYEAHRAKASGAWGDFVGAIAQNLNNSRFYSSLNKRVAAHLCPILPTQSLDRGSRLSPILRMGHFFQRTVGLTGGWGSGERYAVCLARVSNAGWKDATGLGLEVS